MTQSVLDRRNKVYLFIIANLREEYILNLRFTCRKSPTLYKEVNITSKQAEGTLLLSIGFLSEKNSFLSPFRSLTNCVTGQ